jgi:hypothetical protein
MHVLVCTTPPTKCRHLYMWPNLAKLSFWCQINVVFTLQCLQAWNCYRERPKQTDLKCQQLNCSASYDDYVKDRSATSHTYIHQWPVLAWLEILSTLGTLARTSDLEKWQLFHDLCITSSRQSSLQLSATNTPNSDLLFPFDRERERGEAVYFWYRPRPVLETLQHSKVSHYINSIVPIS